MPVGTCEERAGTEHLVRSTRSITESDGESAGTSPGQAQQRNTTVDVPCTGSTQIHQFNQNSDNSTEVGCLCSGKLGLVNKRVNKA